MGLRRVKNLTIDRSKWNRGSITEATERGLQKHKRGLYEPESGGMCCLGFLTKASGAKVLRDPKFSYESPVMTCPPNEINSLYGVDPGPGSWNEFIQINDDDEAACSRAREQELTQLFKERLDINVTFVGETPRPPSHR